MTTILQMSSTELKKQKLTKQLEQEQNQRWRFHGGLSVRGEGGRIQGISTGNKKHNW